MHQDASVKKWPYVHFQIKRSFFAYLCLIIYEREKRGNQ